MVLYFSLLSKIMIFIFFSKDQKQDLGTTQTSPEKLELHPQIILQFLCTDQKTLLLVFISCTKALTTTFTNYFLQVGNGMRKLSQAKILLFLRFQLQLVL